MSKPVDREGPPSRSRVPTLVPGPPDQPPVTTSVEEVPLAPERDGETPSIPPPWEKKTETLPWLSSTRPSTSSESPTLEFFLQTQSERETFMKNVRESLSKLAELDGFIGAALVDADSGMVLGTEGGGSLNLDVAAAGNTEVVRAKRRVAEALNLGDEIEDMLITLGRQYHLLRPLRSRPAIFFYLALERSKSNLALARIKVADVEKGLTL
jgi:predicted regulator of Ras-like GTPase activity (Roadblock/LC7/MglB family)